jgi:hypothetical protein
MANAGTTLDLGRSRPTTNEKRSGRSRAPQMVALAVMLGLAVGTAAWAIAGSHSATGRDDRYDAIQEHRLVAASIAAALANNGSDQIEAHRTQVANAAVEKGSIVVEPADHRLDTIETQGGLPVVTKTVGRASTQGVVTQTVTTSVLPTEPKTPVKATYSRESGPTIAKPGL